MNRWPPRPPPPPPEPSFEELLEELFPSFQELLNKAFEREPTLLDWIVLSAAHRQEEVDRMILEVLTEDAKKWPSPKR